MRDALAAATDAAAAGDVPVGAVVVHDGAVLTRASNRTVRDQDSTAHAELLAIRDASRLLGRWRLDDCTLVVTLEPCAMCAGAIIHARLARLYYGADDPKGGAVEHGACLFAQPNCNHRPEIYGGIGAKQAGALLRKFFADRRT